MDFGYVGIVHQPTGIIRNVPREALKSKKCEDKATEIWQTKRGKEDSAVGCHFGRREFRLRRALCENYATTLSIVETHPVGYRGCLYQACRKQYIMLWAVIFRSFQGDPSAVM
eukprot:scaffold132803_cov35-Attheya_sp.AAC.1